MREAGKMLDAAVLEAEGLAPIGTILKTVQLTQQHRGLSALVLGGVEAAKDKRQAKQQEADQAYDAAAAIIKKLNIKAIDEAWDTARRDWESLRAAVSGGSITVPQSYAAHSALIPKLLIVNDWSRIISASVSIRTATATS